MQPVKFTNLCGMLGNPNFYGQPYQQHTDDQLLKLKAMNVNTVFINIAWSRPWIDAVNLEDVAISTRFPLLSNPYEVEKFRQSLGERVVSVKAAGMKAFAIFGIPRYFDFSKYPDSYSVMKGSSVSTIASASDSVACIQSPELQQFYRELLGDLLTHIPDLDGIQVYTYDELAEVCDEDSDCPRCKGIPAEERIPFFLNRLYCDLQEIKPGFELWWEPWELSAAQSYRIVEQLDVRISLALHSTLNEVYFVNETDQWFRNLAAIAQDQGRKVIGEIFAGGSGEDLGNVIGYPCPRLVYQQINALARTPGVTGMKEYFGFVTEYATVNEEAMGVVTHDPFHSWEVVAQVLSDTYTVKEPQHIRRFWEYAARAIEFIPWELSWVLRFGNLPPYGEYWGSRFVDIMKTPWSTPSWLSNRRSFYLVVDNETNFTPRMQKDLIERLKMSVSLLAQASEISGRVEAVEEKRFSFELQQEAIVLMGFMVKCRLNHLELSFLADCLREKKLEQENGVKQIRSLLDLELHNADGFLRFLQHSTIPYSFRSGDGTPMEHNIIRKTIDKIKKSKRQLSEETLYEWLQNYF